MRDEKPSAWRTTTFGDVATRLVNGGTPPTDIAAFWNGTIPWITGADFTSSGVGEFRRFVSNAAIASTATNVIDKGELLLVTRTGVGKLAIAPCDIAISQDITGVYADRRQVDALFLYHRMRKGVEELKKLNQGTSINGIIRSDLLKYPIDLPPVSQQERIAEILSTLDEAIEQTEALIAKTQAIKAGLMHDLFTRGVTPNGELRPLREEAPQLYKASPLGWIPKEWAIASISEISDSLIDGPFGSNLKSEHYVEDGVRVVRLQNILEGEYNDRDRAFVAKGHAQALARHEVCPGDVLIAALGEDSYPVGRSCCYPSDLPSAINKADCFRLRCLSAVAENEYVMFYLNTVAARLQIRRYEQGVTRRRINLGNLRKVLVAVPEHGEQINLVNVLHAAEDDRFRLECSNAGLQQVKRGLMHDLLTGRVPVPLPEPEALAVDA